MAVWMDGFDFPPELCSKPFALVGISGIDVAKNPSDREVWEALCNNRAPNRAFISFKLIEPQHVFPVMKPKVCCMSLVLTEYSDVCRKRIVLLTYFYVLNISSEIPMTGIFLRVS